MLNTPGTALRPLRIAIIGAGPSGFYAAGGLLNQKDYNVSIDMFDRLPAPYGLVRYGVAPDHQKIKAVTKIYDRTASDPRFRFFGNILLGEDITHSDLNEHYDQIIYAVGAQSDRRLGIPGEDSHNSLSATELVAWYNGHPDYADIEVDLDCESIVVVGVGNVAADVARILAKSEEELRGTDIAESALKRLSKSSVKDIYVLARRGPAQAKFTNPELKELGDLNIADLLIEEVDLLLDPHSERVAADSAGIQRNLKTMHEIAGRTPEDKERRIHLKFLVSPVEIITDESGRVSAVRIEQNELRDEDGYLNAVGTGEYQTIPACMVLRSVGYRGLPLEGVPYDERRGIIPNEGGRLVDPASGEVVPGEYVVGWAKRGPSGVIGTNKPDSLATVKAMMSDIRAVEPAPCPDPDTIVYLLQNRSVRYISIEDWRMLDQIEVANGAIQGRPRVKLTRVNDMIAALDSLNA